ncbi:hypothetical protein HYT58_01575 [Candidatus Woesearchaeota archaeon]|nr:hypothetical protein [Candidatus Woesearchaeota archaeon]
MSTWKKWEEPITLAFSSSEDILFSPAGELVDLEGLKTLILVIPYI